MHAVKVSLAVQTFALSKGNDSGGKKSRIRRSKEERKLLVESFIKKHQYSNNGDFPSLYLTQKEVGGSFYTVREIVREIIQENRVLGPAKFTSEDQNNDLFAEQYPLGSISTEPPSNLSLPSNETYVVSNDHQVIKEQVSTFSEQSTGQHQEISENGRYINEELGDEEYKQSSAIKSLPQNDEVQHNDPKSNKQELVSTSSELLQIFDNGRCNNGILVNEEGKEADASKSSAHVNDEMQISHTLEETLEGVETSTEGCVDASKSSASVNDEMQISHTLEETLEGVETSTERCAVASKSSAHVNDEMQISHTLEETLEGVETSTERCADASKSSAHVNDEIKISHTLEETLEGVETSTGCADASKSSSHVNDEIRISHTLEETLEGVEKSTEGCADASKSLAHVNDEMPQKDMQISHTFEETLEGVETSTLEEASISKVSPLATDVLVETFPLTAADLEKVRNERSYESRNLTRTLEEHETKKKETASTSSKTGTLLDRMEVVEKESSSSIAEKSVGSLGDPLLKSLNCDTNGKSVTTVIVEETDLQVDISCNDASALQTSFQNQVVAPEEPKIAPNDTQGMNANKISSTSGESLSREAVVKEIKTDTQDSRSTEEARNSTLNRINLESWEGASKKPEMNPIVAVFKAFITAFVKLWTE